MRYAIVSDLHANLAAWQTTLADIADNAVDQIICLGDLVGYGPDPVGLLESVYTTVHASLMGNHDAAVCGKMDPAIFSERAEYVVRHHQQQVSAAGLRWLSALPLVVKGPGFRCVHGDFSAPAAFNYIIDPDEALPSWQRVTEQLLFVGHSHLPGIFVIGASGTPHLLDPCDFVLEEGKRYIVNPGSVGYPRMGQCRSSYCIYDAATRTIVFRSLPFDSAGYLQKLRAAGLGDDPWMLQHEGARALPAVRERLSFAKPLTEAQHARNVRQEAALTPAQWKRQIALLLICGFAALCGGAYMAWTHASRQVEQLAIGVEFPAKEVTLPMLNAYPLVPLQRNLLESFPGQLDAGILTGWRYRIADRAKQTLSITRVNHEALLRIDHQGRHEFCLISPYITLTGTRIKSLRMVGRMQKGAGFDGAVSMACVAFAEQPDGKLEQIATVQHEIRNAKSAVKEGIFSVNRKVDLPRRATHIRVELNGRFSGTCTLFAPQVSAAECEDAK